MRLNRSLLIASAITMSLGSVASAQYPQVPPELQKVTDDRKQAANERSDAAFAKAMAQIEKDAANGKPYIPWAAQPGDLPQAPAHATLR